MSETGLLRPPGRPVVWNAKWVSPNGVVFTAKSIAETSFKAASKACVYLQQQVLGATGVHVVISQQDIIATIDTQEFGKSCVEAILDKAVETFRVSKGSLKGSYHGRKTVISIRNSVCYFAREMSGCSWSEIAEVLERRDGTAVGRAHKTVKDKLDSGLVWAEHEALKEALGL